METKLVAERERFTAAHTCARLQSADLHTGICISAWKPAAIVFVFPAVPVFLRLNLASAMILPAGVIAYTAHNLTIFGGCTG